MTVPMTAKLRAFLDEMASDPESAKWGFEALLERANFTEYFDYLRERGLFAPELNPRPLPVEGGYVRIESWPALDYLKKCAEAANNDSDRRLAAAILQVVELVTTNVAANDGEPDNYHTFHAFAEILGLLPLDIVLLRHIELARVWLASRYDRGLVSIALDKGVMRKALGSAEAADWPKADLLLDLCTQIRWVEDKSFGRAELRPISVVEDHWLLQFLTNHAVALGAKRGPNASAILLARIREIFGSDLGLSLLWRPAIEDHPQNYDQKKVGGRLVEGLRDVLLSWVDSDSAGAKVLIEKMLADEVEVVRRIAIHTVNEKWSALEECYAMICAPEYFDYDHLHELYRLLQVRFASLPPAGKAATVKAIRQIPLVDTVRDPAGALRRMQIRWLSAIAGKGSPEGDAWLEQLRAEEGEGAVPDHPDFASYSYIRSGFGPTPLAPEDILALLRKGELITRLNDFREISTWDGPSVRSLADSVSEAVGLDFDLFADQLQDFLAAKRPYQFAVLNGFMKLWRDPQRKPSQQKWDAAWPALVEFWEGLLVEAAFWTEEIENTSERSTPTREWIPGLIAELIEVGTKSDDQAYDADLLPRTRVILMKLLEHLEAVEEPSDDPMSQAINSPRGKAAEALVNHALRECRLSDREGPANHIEVWKTLAPIFDKELDKCREGNYEFSTIAGLYLPNLLYLSAEWTRQNVTKLFPVLHSKNLLCAVAGLAYGRATRDTYLLLSKANVVNAALDVARVGSNSRERLVERVALAYIWRDETLGSPIIRRFFDPQDTKDLQDVSDFFWSVSSQGLETPQKESILEFWRFSVDWGISLQTVPAGLMAHLARLVCYLDFVPQADGARMLQLASYVTHDAFHQVEYFEQLKRFARIDAKLVISLIQAVMESGKPFSDYEGHLKSALEIVAEEGERESAIRLADGMRDVSGMRELYTALVSGSEKVR